MMERIRAIVTPKWILGLSAAVLLGFGLGSWFSPLQAGNLVDPKLRQQVLQILRENPEVILESVKAYQRQQQDQQEKSRQSFLQNMKSDPGKVIGQSPTKGAKAAKVVLVEFSDFQCPYCAKAKTTLDQFMTKHQDRVTLVYKHLPLVSIHPNALPAAKAAWAAGQQGKFWEFHDALFAQQPQIGEALYPEIAKSLKLDLQKFDRDRNSAAATQAIEQDTKMAEQLGVDGTPFFVLNGQAFSGGVQLAELESALAQVSSP